MSRASCTLKVAELDCPTEAKALQAALDGMDGVIQSDFDLIHGTATIHYDSEATLPSAIVRRAVARTGYKINLIDESPNNESPPEANPWILVGISGVLLALGMAAGWLHFNRWISLICFVGAVAAGAIELFPQAIRSAMRRQLDIHVLMTMAVLGAVALGQWDEAATVAFLFGLSEALEALSVSRARVAIRSLLEIEPNTAELLENDGSVRTVDPQTLRVDNRVRVRAGTRIPIDGQVTAGRSNVDQKAITGESTPVSREVGDSVFAGTINGDGALEVVATAELGDSLISRIIERVRAAQSSRTPIEQSIDRFATIYTPLVVVFALAVALGGPAASVAINGSADWPSWFQRALVVLVVACPCALVIATPVAVASALASAARRGVLVKGGQFLEEFGRLRVLAFDKTGTLTAGMPEVVEVVPENSPSDDLLRIAAALGEQGGHVLGKAISRHARSLSLDVPTADSYAAVPGLGATGRINSNEYHIGSHRYLDEAGLCPPDFHLRMGHAESSLGTAVAVTGASGPLGYIRLADHPRPEAARVLSELSELGVQTLMLTGDNPSAADAVGRAIGLSDLRAGLLPADKATMITDLIANRGSTGMVGDGVNDAPALAAARVSVALGGVSSPAAIETADVVLMADDLSQIPWLVRHSRRTLSRIRQNITLALVTKAIVIVLALFNLATLWMAILADVGTTLVVTANALRLLKSAR